MIDQSDSNLRENENTDPPESLVEEVALLDPSIDKPISSSGSESTSTRDSEINAILPTVDGLVVMDNKGVSSYVPDENSTYARSKDGYTITDVNSGKKTTWHGTITVENNRVVLKEMPKDFTAPDGAKFSLNNSTKPPQWTRTQNGESQTVESNTAWQAFKNTSDNNNGNAKPVDANETQVARKPETPAEAKTIADSFTSKDGTLYQREPDSDRWLKMEEGKEWEVVDDKTEVENAYAESKKENQQEDAEAARAEAGLEEKNISESKPNSFTSPDGTLYEKDKETGNWRALAPDKEWEPASEEQVAQAYEKTVTGNQEKPVEQNQTVITNEKPDSSPSQKPQESTAQVGDTPESFTGKDGTLYEKDENTGKWRALAPDKEWEPASDNEVNEAYKETTSTSQETVSETKPNTNTFTPQPETNSQQSEQSADDKPTETPESFTTNDGTVYEKDETTGNWRTLAPDKEWEPASQQQAEQAYAQGGSEAASAGTENTIEGAQAAFAPTQPSQTQTESASAELNQTEPRAAAESQATPDSFTTNDGTVYEKDETSGNWRTLAPDKEWEPASQQQAEQAYQNTNSADTNSAESQPSIPNREAETASGGSEAASVGTENTAEGAQAAFAPSEPPQTESASSELNRSELNRSELNRSESNSAESNTSTPEQFTTNDGTIYQRNGDDYVALEPNKEWEPKTEAEANAAYQKTNEANSESGQNSQGPPMPSGETGSNNQSLPMPSGETAENGDRPHENPGTQVLGEDDTNTTTESESQTESQSASAETTSEARPAETSQASAARVSSEEARRDDRENRDRDTDASTAPSNTDRLRPLIDAAASRTDRSQSLNLLQRMGQIVGAISSDQNNKSASKFYLTASTNATKMRDLAPTTFVTRMSEVAATRSFLTKLQEVSRAASSKLLVLPESQMAALSRRSLSSTVDFTSAARIGKGPSSIRMTSDSGPMSFTGRGLVSQVPLNQLNNHLAFNPSKTRGEHRSLLGTEIAIAGIIAAAGIRRLAAERQAQLQHQTESKVQSGKVTIIERSLTSQRNNEGQLRANRSIDRRPVVDVRSAAQSFSTTSDVTRRLEPFRVGRKHALLGAEIALFTAIAAAGISRRRAEQLAMTDKINAMRSEKPYVYQSIANLKNRLNDFIFTRNLLKQNLKQQNLLGEVVLAGSFKLRAKDINNFNQNFGKLYLPDIKRKKQKEDDKKENDKGKYRHLEVAEDADKETSNQGEQNPVLFRPTWLVSAGETLVSIAEDLYSDANLGWLIADLNRNQTKEHFIDGKRIVELQIRQRIHLPVWQDIVEFYRYVNRDNKPENLVTILVENQLNKEVIANALGVVIGKEESKEASTTTTPTAKPVLAGDPLREFVFKDNNHPKHPVAGSDMPPQHPLNTNDWPQHPTSANGLSSYKLPALEIDFGRFIRPAKYRILAFDLKQQERSGN